MIGLIKMLATPLIRLRGARLLPANDRQGKGGLIMVGISAVNAALALVIGLTLAIHLQPGRFLAVPSSTGQTQEAFPEVRAVHFLDDLLGLLPTNLVDPFRTNAIVPVVVLAVLAGAALRRYKEEQVAEGSREHLAIEGFVAGGLRALETDARLGRGPAAALPCSR